MVGLAAAWVLRHRSTRLRVLVLEKKHERTRHQTDRNRGVIHSGIYYRPGSLKAWHAREGSRRLVQRVEPAVRGLAGLPVPSAGVVDFRDVANVLAQQLSQLDAERAKELYRSLSKVAFVRSLARMVVETMSLHVLSAPSPAATAAHSLGESIAAQVDRPTPLPVPVA
jgi:hypothetical protein